MPNAPATDRGSSMVVSARRAQRAIGLLGSDALRGKQIVRGPLVDVPDRPAPQCPERALPRPVQSQAVDDHLPCRRVIDAGKEP